ncbi:unnamed protein product [Heligmosomoides polygyrus]|uniref:Uncharacterized protein n=1 Tax=Heligmosomoides polygyrus TaxID=6339 RepID=A0A183FAH7_HELPZ|nr:unnamed protein product [Heligmosomoides polygyrus]
MMPDFSKAHLLSTLFVARSSNLEKRGNLSDDNEMGLHSKRFPIDQAKARLSQGHLVRPTAIVEIDISIELLPLSKKTTTHKWK